MKFDRKKALIIGGVVLILVAILVGVLVSIPTNDDPTTTTTTTTTTTKKPTTTTTTKPNDTTTTTAPNGNGGTTTAKPTTTTTTTTTKKPSDTTTTTTTKPKQDDVFTNDDDIVLEGGDFEDGAVLEATSISLDDEESTEVLEAIAEQDYDDSEPVYIYEISVVKNEVKIQPNGKVKVTISVEDDLTGYDVLHIKDDGTVERLEATYADGKISFETDSFSKFVLVKSPKPEPKPTPHTHTVVVDAAVPATCTKAGLTEGSHCSECGEVLTAQEDIPMLDHTESEWIVDKEATIEEEGSKHTECTVCGSTIKTETIEKIYSKGLEFTLNDDGESYSVSGIGTCTDTDIVIPSTYEGKPVTSIGDYAFYKCASLTSVTIPDSVTGIYGYAFGGCTSLTSVTILDSVTSIGGSAFRFCTSLTSVIIPNSVTNIGDLAFHNCTSLTSITIPDSVTSIGGSAFANCTSLTNAAIGNGVTSIKFGTFVDCSSLTSVTIGDGVTSIDDWAFKFCTSLTNVTIPDSVMSIGSFAFGGCTSLEYNEYDNAYYLGNSSNPYILLVKAKSKDIANCNINSNTRFIHSGAFYNCAMLTSVTIPEGITSIGDEVFAACESLTSVTIPNSVTSIGSSAFYNCTSLKEIHYNGTQEQWNAISKASHWIRTISYTIYCTDGEISE